MRHPDPRPVSAAVQGPAAGRTLRAPRRICGPGPAGPAAWFSARRVGPPGAQLLPRLEARRVSGRSRSQLFGEELSEIMNDLNEVLAA